MPYIYLDKETETFELYGSLPVMCQEHNLDKEYLGYWFSRKKNTEYENQEVKIVKAELKRGGKDKIKDSAD